MPPGAGSRRGGAEPPDPRPAPPPLPRLPPPPLPLQRARRGSRRSGMLLFIGGDDVDVDVDDDDVVVVVIVASRM